jgi:transposase-like protein
MTKQPKSFSPQEKSQVALAAIKGEKTMAQIGSDYRVHPTQIGLWKKQALDRLPDIFKDNRRKEKHQETEYREQLDNLYRMIGQKDIELDFLKKKLSVLRSG